MPSDGKGLELRGSSRSSRGDSSGRGSSPSSGRGDKANSGLYGRGGDSSDGGSRGSGRSSSRSQSPVEDKKSSGRRSSSRGTKERSKSERKSERNEKPDDKKKAQAGRDNEHLGRTKKMTGTQGLSCEGTVYYSLPKLRDVPAEQQELLLCRKLRECCTMYDFKKESMLPEKEGKRQTLVELVDFISSTKGLMVENVVRESVDMVSTNVFRTYSKREKHPIDILDPEDEELLGDDAWPHLELVYEYFLKMVSMKDLDQELALKYIQPKMVLKLFDLMDSDDPKERDSLKVIINKLYGKFSVLRSCIRRAAQEQIQRVFGGDEAEGHQNGIAELLEIMSRIISTFAVPFKEESVDVLLKVLIPLHKIEWLCLFHKELLECTKKFWEKDPKLSLPIMTAILRYWPCTLAAKQILFIQEVDELLHVMPPAEFSRVRADVGSRFAQCLSCPHSDVAEKSLQLWRSERFVKLMTQQCKDQYPVYITALYNNATQHWHSSVVSRTIEVLRTLMDRNPDLFDSSSTQHRKNCEDLERKSEERERKWMILQALYDYKWGAAAETEEEERPEDHLQSMKAEESMPVRGMPTGDAVRGMITDTTNHNTIYNLDALRKPALDDDYDEDGMLSPISKKSPQTPQPVSAAATTGPAWSQTEKEASLPTSPVNDKSDGDGQLRGDGGLNLPPDRFGFAVSWEPAFSLVELGVQALLVDSRGKIIGAVHECNPVASTAVVCRGDDKPTVSAVRSNCSGTVWIAPGRMPKQVVLVILVVSALANGHFGDSSDQCVHLVGGTLDNQLAHYPLESPTGEICVLGVVRRSADAWSLVMNIEYPRVGRHFMDIVEPTLSRIMRQAVPTLPKRHKATTTLNTLECGTVACLPLPSVAKWLFFGLSWDVSPSVIRETVSLVTAAVLLDHQGQSLGACCPDHPEVFGMRHGGSGLMGQGLVLDLLHLSQDVAQIFIVGHVSSDPGASMELLQRPQCCAVDCFGMEILRYQPFLQLQQVGTKRVNGFIAGRLFRLEGSGTTNNRSTRWAFQALQTACFGETWQESVSEMQNVFEQPVSAFQTLPAEAPVRSLVSL